MVSFPTTRRKVSAFVARFFVTCFLTGSVKLGAVLYDSISRTPGFTRASAGSLLVLPSAVSLLAGPGVNVLMRYIGPRSLATFGGFLFGAGFVCSGLCALKPPLLFLFFTVSGFGMGCMGLPTVSYVKEVFGDTVRLALPLAMLGSNAGLIVFPSVIVYSHREFGTNNTLLLFGAFSWNLVPLGLLLDNEKHSDKIPEASNESMEGAMSRQTENPPGNGKRWLQEFKNFDVLLFFVVTNVRKIPADAWTLYLMPRSEASGMSAPAAAGIVSMGGIGGGFGRLVASVSFGIGGYKPVLLCGSFYVMSGLVFVAMEAFVYPSRLVWPAYICGFVNAIFLAAVSGMRAGVLHLLVSDENFVAVYAVIDMGNGLQTLLAGFGPGFLVDVYGNYEITFIVMSIISFSCGGMCIVIWISVQRTQRKPIKNKLETN